LANIIGLSPKVASGSTKSEQALTWACRKENSLHLVYTGMVAVTIQRGEIREKIAVFKTGAIEGPLVQADWCLGKKAANRLVS